MKNANAPFASDLANAGGAIVPAVPNTFALVYDVDNDADGVQCFAVIAWHLTYQYCGVVGRRIPVLLPIGVCGDIDISKPHAVQIGGAVLANGCRFPSTEEWLETFYSN